MDKKENLLELENVEIDPLYNDKADEDDAQWVEKNLYSYFFKKNIKILIF